MIDEDWIRAAIDAPETNPGDPAALARLRTMLESWAEGFAAARPDVESALITWPRRGLHPDEAAGFLAALDRAEITVDPAGYVNLAQVRPKTPAGRYALFSRSGPGVAINLEYLIQIGTACELVREWGWPADAVNFERGEFDAFGHEPDSDRIVLAVEAKARMTGADSLAKLLRAWVLTAIARSVPAADNAGRKYAQLQALCAAGPVLVWLVAAGRRWAFRAVDAAGHPDLTPIPDVSYERAVAPVEPVGRQVLDVRPYDPALHRTATLASSGQCSWFCTNSAAYTVRVRELGGSESTFGLCAPHRQRVEDLYSG